MKNIFLYGIFVLCPSVLLAQKPSLQPSPPVNPPDSSRINSPGGVHEPRMKNSSGSWIGIYDYPPTAAKFELGGKTSFELAIGIDGSVADCVIMESSGVQALDVETCKLVKRRARFSPATDANGQPTTGIFSSRVIWNPEVYYKTRFLGGAAQPDSNPESWITTNPFLLSPKLRASKNKEKIITMRLYKLSVDADGGVRQCQVMPEQEIGNQNRATKRDVQVCNQYLSNARFRTAPPLGTEQLRTYYPEVLVEKIR